MEKLIYELPKDNDILAEIVKNIPSNWGWIDGYLCASRELYLKKQVAENTGMLISRFYSIRPTIVGRKECPYGEMIEIDRAERVKPKIRDVVLRGKLVSSINFDEAGYETEDIEMDDVKELVSGFLERGYKGWISAYSGCKDNSKYNNPERFSFIHAKTGVTFLNRVSLPPHILLECDERYGGKKENLGKLIEVIQSFNLKGLAGIGLIER